MKTLTLFASSLLLGCIALAQEGAPQMPDMTPPKELAKMHPLIGTWKGKEKHFEPGRDDVAQRAPVSRGEVRLARPDG